MVHEPTRLDQDAAYVEQLGALRDLRDQPSKEPEHVTKAAQIEALTAAVSELHEQSTKVHDALRTVLATHTREMKKWRPPQSDQWQAHRCRDELGEVARQGDW